MSQRSHQQDVRDRAAAEAGESLRAFDGRATALLGAPRAPQAPDAAAERAARATLRAQIAKLEGELSAILAERFPFLAAPAAFPQRPAPAVGPHLPGLGELERSRDRLAARLQELRARAALRSEHERRSSRYAASLASMPAGKDGHMHPNRIFAALAKLLAPDAITIADGGDILSFARMGLPPRTYLDSGAFGCLGVGVPYGVAAALLHPDRQVVVITGDGAFGINAMEIDSAKRHGAKVVFIVANNAAWNIERLDQEMNYGGRVVGTTLQWSDYAAMARAFGLHGERVTDAARLEGALAEAFAHAPALIDVVVTRDALSSDAGKGLGWVPTYQALTAWDEAERARRNL